ncbi:MAG: HD-GYP domain-containing protein [Phycisphaerales bacterium]|nr:HD-GYP domain-containing protein [Phycisphaerales bacterium]MCB9857678.1 HD-GYP domain-containing protein [Phycisphaerales bacterium]MCB9864767.1 HD-GYP domain-containing protein [Phycisphaerales bacterium]
MSGKAPPSSSSPTNVPPNARANAEGVLNVTRLGVGQQLDTGLYDQDGVLLLAAGTVVTQDFLRLLRRWKIRYVQTWKTPPPIKTHVVDEATITRLESEMLRPDFTRLNVKPLDPARRPRVTLEELNKRAARGAERHASATGDMAEFCEQLEKGGKVSDRDLYRIARDFADMVAVDMDLLPTVLSLRSSPDDYLYQHCVNVAALSMVMATQLGLRRERVLEVGLGGMLQDVGMLRVPLAIRRAPRPLTPEEIKVIEKHPAYTLEYLANIGGLPRDVRFLGFQVHERIDQSGYPRGRAEKTIHAYAKIVSVADVYVAMTSPRPYRAAHSPYEAIKTILYECGAGRYESTVVRALLDCISLFPTGSFVELEDGRYAKVLRANPSQHTRPVIQVVSEDLATEYGVFDMSQAIELKIAKPLAP